MKNTTPTVYGDFIQASRMAGRPFEMYPYTTLNERLGILAGVAPGANKYPDLNWICIGNEGHRAIIDGQSSWNTAREHKPTDGGPFELLPFVMRPVNNDLTQAERTKFAGRRIEEHGGQNYVCYYLMAVDKSTMTPSMVLIENNAGVISYRPFVPDASNLSPTPTDLAPEEVISASGQQVGVRMVLPVVLSASVIEGIIEACRIKYNNAARAVLSEICLVAGVPYVTNGQSSGGGVVEYTEVISAQVIAHLITHYSLPYVNNQIREDMVIGTSNPLLNG